MWKDPIIEELDKMRKKHAKEQNYDLRKLYEEIKQQERKSGRTYVSFIGKQQSAEEVK